MVAALLGMLGEGGAVEEAVRRGVARADTGDSWVMKMGAGSSLGSLVVGVATLIVTILGRRWLVKAVRWVVERLRGGRDNGEEQQQQQKHHHHQHHHQHHHHYDDDNDDDYHHHRHNQDNDDNNNNNNNGDDDEKDAEDAAPSWSLANIRGGGGVQ